MHRESVLMGSLNKVKRATEEKGQQPLGAIINAIVGWDGLITTLGEPQTKASCVVGESKVL